MESLISLYKLFVSNITKILTNENKQQYLHNLDIERDRDIIIRFFLEVDKKPEWTNDDWINSMSNIKLGILSFLFKNKITLGDVYNFSNNNMEKMMLLESYKLLVNKIISINQITNINISVLKEQQKVADLNKKQIYLYLNFKNFKNPKFLAYLFDLMADKDVRNNLFSSVLKGNHEINLKEIIPQISDGKHTLEECIDKILKNNYIDFIIDFIMNIDVCGDIVIPKKLYQYIMEYKNELISNSIILQNFLKKHDGRKSTFHSRVTLKIIETTISIRKGDDAPDLLMQAYLSSNNIDISTIDFDFVLKKINNPNYKPNYNSKNINERIVEIICFILEGVYINMQKPTSEKNLIINSLIKKFINNQNIFEFSDEIKNEINKENIFNISNFDKKEDIKQLLQEIKSTLLENLKLTTEEVIVLKSILEDIAKLEILIKSQDIKNLSNFNHISTILEKIKNNQNLIKSFILELIKPIYMNHIIKFLESKTIFKTNKVLKEKIIESFLFFLKEISMMIQSSAENIIEYNQFITFIGKICDKVFFFILKFKSKSNNQSIVQYTKVIQQQK